MNPEKSCGLLIRKIHNTMEKNANNSLRSSGLTHAQMSALMAIREAPKKQLSLKELEKSLSIAQSTTAGIMFRLGKKGLVSGFSDPEDKRIKLVRITQAGKKYCCAAEKDMEKAEERLLSGLTQTEREIFYSLLQKVSKMIG